MLRFTTSTANVPTNAVTSLRPPKTSRLPGMLALALTLAAAPAFAKDPPAAESKLPTKGPASHVQAHADAVAIPECLDKLNLTAQQQEQVKTIIHNYDGSLGMVWKKFGHRYMQAIEMETSLLAAIEDSMTEPQRQQVRVQRKKMAQHEKVMAATNTKVNQAVETPGEETTKPATAAAEAATAAGITLTDDQEAAADKLHEKYRTQLRSLNRDIQGLHTQLVSLEADKLVEIEKVLTKDQLAQLRTHRQSAPVAPKVATSTHPTKTE